jgi:PAS domain S-box-containing protein
MPVWWQKRERSLLGLVQRFDRWLRADIERLVEERVRALEWKGKTYLQIFESAHDPILIFRPDDEQVLNVNRRACEIYGFTREEFLRISLAALSENVPRGQQQIRETLESGVYHNFESVHFRKDGSRMFLEINASKIEYEGQLAVLSINRDVTERRRAEELRLAKEAAERTAQAKAQFLANMSHEIRTPMAGVIGLADLLLSTDLDEQQAQFARLLQSSAVALLRVIDDLLGFSTIEAGELAFEAVPFAPRATLREVVAGAGRPARARRILAAEDNPVNQLVVTEHLKSLGYEVTAVGNGLEALEALQAGDYDLVLMDCQMPHLDGYEATLRIRRLPGKTGRIPIVALTAHAIREELDKCLAVGMSDYITKPFRGETLKSKLDHWLGSAPEEPAAAREPCEMAGETLDSRQIAFLVTLRQESGTEVIERLVAQFRGQRHLEDLRAALADGDRGALRLCAHRLKGTSSLLGAVRLPRLCAELEQLCPSATQDECRDCLALIEAEHGKVVRGLAVLLESGFQVAAPRGE